MGATFKVKGNVYIEKQIEIKGGAVQFIDNHYAEDPKKEDKQAIDLPSDLKTPFIEERLNRLIDEGYLDEKYQPVKNKCPWSIASVIAKELGELASIPKFYQVFGLLWQHNTLGADFQGFLNNNTKAIEIQQDIHDLLV